MYVLNSNVILILHRMSKDTKNTKSDTISRIKIAVIILILILVTYVIMAVVTDLSLNLESGTYKFMHSLKAIFDTHTAIFKFFRILMAIFGVWILLAVFIKYFYSLFFKNK
jgi:hypothetical protein